MQGFRPKFVISNTITAVLARIERARGFLDAAMLSEEWIREMGSRALLEFEAFQPDVNRRSLQQDLRIMVEKGLMTIERATNKLVYRFRETK